MAMAMATAMAMAMAMATATAMAMATATARRPGNVRVSNTPKNLDVGTSETRLLTASPPATATALLSSHFPT
jgi:hypothetical protein